MLECTLFVLKIANKCDILSKMGYSFCVHVFSQFRKVSVCVFSVF